MSRQYCVTKWLVIGMHVSFSMIKREHWLCHLQQLTISRQYCLPGKHLYPEHLVHHHIYYFNICTTYYCVMYYNIKSILIHVNYDGKERQTMETQTMA